MTTNSPNTVDGDVQALNRICDRQRLTAFCKSEAERLDDVVKAKGHLLTEELRMKLYIYKLALASLLAEPDHYKIDVYKGDRLIASCHPSEPEGSPAEEPYRFVETAYYTTPPARVFSVEESIPNSRLIRLIKWADDAKSIHVAAALRELQEYRKSASPEGLRLDDISMLLARVVLALKKHEPDSHLVSKTVDYLKGNGLSGPLRAADIEVQS